MPSYRRNTTSVLGLIPLPGAFFWVLLCLGAAHPALAQSEVPGPERDREITRGRGYVTLTFSLDQRQAENEDQLIQQVVDQDRLRYNVTLNGGYALRDNFTLGLGLQYNRSREDRVFVSEGEELTSKYLMQGVTFGPRMRNYVPLGSGVLQILVQTNLDFTLEESLERIFRASDIDKIEEDVFEVALGVKPGAVLFFDRHWAFEVAVGLAGLSSRTRTLTQNDDTDNQTRVVINTIDLDINLLALSLGVAYYF